MSDLPGRYYERIGQGPAPPMPENRFTALFDSYDVGDSSPKDEHFLQIINRFGKILVDNGVTQIFVHGQASHTGSHAFNFQLAQNRADRLSAALLTFLNAQLQDTTQIDVVAIKPDQIDLHEEAPAGEHKRFRRVTMSFDLLAFQGDIPDLIPDPAGLNEEKD